MFVSHLFLCSVLFVFNSLQSKFHCTNAYLESGHFWVTIFGESQIVIYCFPLKSLRYNKARKSQIFWREDINGILILPSEIFPETFNRFMHSLNRAIISILMPCVCDRWTNVPDLRQSLFADHQEDRRVMMSRGKHLEDWVTVTKSLTSWRMTQHSGIATQSL